MGISPGQKTAGRGNTAHQCLWPPFQAVDASAYQADKFRSNDAHQRRGRPLSNYVYIDNLIDATLLATKRDESVGQAYIITDDIALPWKDFFGCYAQMAGKPQIRSVPEGLGKIVALGMEITSKFTGKPPKITRQAVSFLTRKARFNIEKARRELGYQPRFSLKEGMRITEEWLREEGHLGKSKD